MPSCCDEVHAKLANFRKFSVQKVVSVAGGGGGGGVGGQTSYFKLTPFLLLTHEYLSTEKKKV